MLNVLAFVRYNSIVVIFFLSFQLLDTNIFKDEMALCLRFVLKRQGEEEQWGTDETILAISQ